MDSHLSISDSQLHGSPIPRQKFQISNQGSPLVGISLLPFLSLDFLIPCYSPTQTILREKTPILHTDMKAFGLCQTKADSRVQIPSSLGSLFLCGSAVCLGFCFQQNLAGPEVLLFLRFLFFKSAGKKIQLLPNSLTSS